MGRHYEGRIHWHKLYAMLKKHKQKGISIYELADQLEIDKNDKEIRKTIDQLVSQKRVRLSLGVRNNMLCQVVQATNLGENDGEFPGDS